jgi:hypothetical protein
MLIYNVTVCVDPTIEYEWNNWMLAEHVREVLATGCFTAFSLLRVEADGVEEPTYAVQYSCASKSKLETYQKEHASALQQKTLERWGEKVLAFRSILHTVAEGHLNS